MFTADWMFASITDEGEKRIQKCWPRQILCLPPTIQSPLAPDASKLKVPCSEFAGSESCLMKVCKILFNPFRHSKSTKSESDAAHTIRSGSTKKLYQNVARLDSKLRWCLTGTRVQNKVEDLGSLVSFLRIPQLDTAAAFRKHAFNHS